MGMGETAVEQEERWEGEFWLVHSRRESEAMIRGPSSLDERV